MMDMNDARAVMAANIETARGADPAMLREIRQAVENAIRTGNTEPINGAVAALRPAPAALSGQ